MSDRIAVMNEGKVLQVGTPTEIYERPNNRFCADFIGETNFIAGKVVETDAASAAVETTHGRLCAASMFAPSLSARR